MRRLYLLLPIVLLTLCFTQCSEEELFTDGGLSSGVQLNSARTLDSRVPEITNVKVSGSKVSVEFTNYAAPKKPEGGFELMADGKRTYTSLTPRSYSTAKKVTMTFSTSSPNRTYQIYARWNSGYVRSNEMKAGAGNNQNSPSSPEESSDNSSNEVKRPSNAKKPVISNLAFSGSRVTLDFVNFASPGQPEGGFELMVDGKRTGTSIIPRLYSNEKDLKLSFSISNPQDRCFQIYARWNSGYISSDELCREGQQSGVGNSSADDNENSPEEVVESKDDGRSALPSGLPSLKLVRGYEFNNNIGSDVNVSRDGLKVHHLGRQDGRIVREGGEGAYRFMVTPGSYSKNDHTYRHELIPRNLPSPYFDKGRRAKWGKEYVYELRMRISDRYDIGSDYTNFMSFKNDYTVYREASHTTHIEGDHYYMRHMFSSRSGAGSQQASRKHFYFGANNERLSPGKDFSKSRRTGSGYQSIEREKERWITWTYHIKWSYGSDGFFRIYKNGKLFHSYNGPNAYKDQAAPYVKFGLYNSFWKNGQRTGSTRQEIFVDYFRIYVPK